jgi:cytochrome c-type biogenesis protein CcmF
MLPASLGSLGIVVAFVAACLGLVAQAVATWRTSQGLPVAAWLDGRRLVVLVLAGVLLSVGSMEYALVTHDFALAYVADNNATVTPLLYSITGLWSALEGSILLWALVLTVVTSVFIVAYRRRHDDAVVGWATVVLLAADAFFLGLIAGPATPFALSGGSTPTQGAGPNALLQDNLLVAIHPPLIYSGLVVFTVPFALAIGTLAAGRFSPVWQAATRRWALVGWTSLTVGVLLGAWWSYQVLGWGGFWGWDPVENAALLPWLVATAYVHSVVVEERRGLFRIWNLVLAISVFALTILATYFTRSGVLESVHAFSSSTLGPILLGFLGVVLATGLGLLAWRGARLRAPGALDEPRSREGAFVANNVLFVGFAAVVLLGTVFPLAYEAIRHSTVTVGPPYFDAVAVPAGLVVLLLMAVTPVLGWRHVDLVVVWRRMRVSAWLGALVVVALVAAGVRGVLCLVAYFLAVVAAGTACRTLWGNLRATRARATPLWHGLTGRSSGGMVVHLGVVLAAVAIVSSSSYATHALVTLRPGGTTVVGGHSITYVGLREVVAPVDRATQIEVRVDGGGLFYPALTQYPQRDDATVGTPAIDSSLFGDDVYLTYVELGAGSAASGGTPVPDLKAGWVVLGVTVEPLVSWLWAGGLVAGLGGVLALAGGRKRRRIAVDPVEVPIADLVELEAVAP